VKQNPTTPHLVPKNTRDDICPAFRLPVRTFFVAASSAVMRSIVVLVVLVTLAHNVVGLTQVASVTCPAEGGKASSVTLWDGGCSFASFFFHFVRVDYLHAT
jgi:hypothetical protein